MTGDEAVERAAHDLHAYRRQQLYPDGGGVAWHQLQPSEQDRIKDEARVALRAAGLGV